MEITLTPEEHQAQEKKAREKVHKKWLYIVCAAVLIYGSFNGLIPLLHKLTNVIIHWFKEFFDQAEGFKYTFSICAIIIISIVAYVLVNKKTFRTASLGLQKIILIWILDITIRVAVTMGFITLTDFMITEFVPLNRFSFILWTVFGVALNIITVYMMIKSFIKSISSEIKPDELGQLMLGKETPIPYLGSNLHSFPLPLLPGITVRGVPAAPTQIKVTDKKDNQGRENSLEIIIKSGRNLKNGDEDLAVPHSVEMIFFTKVIDTYRALKSPLKPEAQAAIGVGIVIPPLQAYNFHQLKHNGAERIAKITKKAIDEINAKLINHGIDCDRLQITDPVENPTVLAARLKDEADRINEEGLHHRGRSWAALTDEEKDGVREARINEGITRESKLTTSDSSQPGGKRNKNSKRSGTGSKPTIIFDMNRDHHHDHNDDDGDGD